MLIKSIIRKRKLRIFIASVMKKQRVMATMPQKTHKGVVSLNLLVMDDLEPIYSTTRLMMKLFLKYRALAR